jgi:DNA-binding NtrC family response regulator
MCPDAPSAFTPSMGLDPRATRPIRRFALFLLTRRPVVRVIDHPILVGRSADCDVSVDDVASSSAHLRIAPGDGGVRITEIDHRNRTFVDGQRLNGTTTLARGVVRFGDIVALIDAAPELRLSGRADGGDSDRTPLVGGAALAPCRRVASTIARTALPVMITGEIGTGKKMLARWMHEESQRSGPFITVDCALPRQLLTTELFGDVASAASRIAAAASGTLFLNDIDRVPARLQGKLLRVLDDHFVRAIDVRVIGTTDQDLKAACARGAFRSDLYARLAGAEIAMPPLRNHVEDLPTLIEELCRRAGVAPSISADALEAFARYLWPGNVRELDLALRHAIARSPERFELEHLPGEICREFRTSTGVRAAPLDTRTRRLTRLELDAALNRHRGNVRQVAIALGIPRSSLYRFLERWELSPDAHRT